MDELCGLCKGFFAEGKPFDLIGHTSNTLYTPDYCCERMVSTRKLNRFEIKETEIVCECGTSVRQLALAAIKAGIKGFEGLVDLPGTVAASLYGNAGCYDCSISSLLNEATVLTEEGNLETVGKEWFAFTKRSSSLKRGDRHAVILSISLRREDGNADELKIKAEQNHATRKASQPEAKNSLGSIFAESGKPTLLYWGVDIISKAYSLALRLTKNSKESRLKKRKHLTFLLLNATDIEPYVKQWNWYQWSDEKAHELFWKYVKLHKRLFTKSEFEIEIKHNKNLKIP